MSTNRIQELMQWADGPVAPPRVRELKKFIDNMMRAMQQDAMRTKHVMEIANQLQSDRDHMAQIAFKLCRKVLEDLTFDVLPEEDELNDNDFRLYTAARINQSLALFVGQPLTPESIVAMRAKAQEAFDEVANLGCSSELVADMKKNFEASFKAEPPEDAALRHAGDDATVDGAR